MGDEIRKEKVKVAGEKLLQTVKKLVHEGNVRRISIKDEQDRTIVEIPLTVGVVGVLLAPAAVAIGAIAALVANFTIEVERVERPQRIEPAAARH
jgi:hypothetical protein